jgi:hypothetical protein
MNALLNTRNILPRDAAGVGCEAIRSSAGNRERQALLERKIICSGERQSRKRRITAADARF